MKRVLILSGAPSPYREDLFYYLQSHYKDSFEFHIVYASRPLRNWEINTERQINTQYLKSLKIRYNRKNDKRIIIVSYGITSTAKKIKPDIVVVSEYNTTVQFLVAYAKTRHIPIVSWTDATMISEREISRMQKYFRKRVISTANSFIASSSKSKELLISYGAPQAKIFISMLTVDIDKYLEKPEFSAKNRIICVGTLIKRKGVDLLMRAVSQLKVNYHLDIVGDGEKKSDLIKLASELNISHNITFHGYMQQEQIRELYRNADLFVLPTREDCFGLVTLEAMCAGLPIVTSKYADGSYDLVDEGINGYIVDPEDSNRLAEAISSILSDITLRESFGNMSYKKVQQFTFENVSINFIKAINSAISSKDEEKNVYL